jgi:hypothetical protein
MNELDEPVIGVRHPDLQPDGHAEPVLPVEQHAQLMGQVQMAHDADPALGRRLTRQRLDPGDGVRVAVAQIGVEVDGGGESGRERPRRDAVRGPARGHPGEGVERRHRRIMEPGVAAEQLVRALPGAPR